MGARLRIEEVEVEAALVLIVVVAGLITIHLLGLWAERKGWIFWRKERRGDAAGGMLDAMDQLFAPSKAHAVEEIHSKKTTRIDASTGEGIDLDAGKAYLSSNLTRSRPDCEPDR